MSWLSSGIDQVLGDWAPVVDRVADPLVRGLDQYFTGGAVSAFSPAVDTIAGFSGRVGPVSGGVAITRSGAVPMSSGGSVAKRQQHWTYVNMPDGSVRRFYIRKSPKTGKMILSHPNRMNPFNPCALKRALRRTHTFAKFARKIIRTEHHFKPSAAKGRVGHRRSK